MEMSDIDFLSKKIENLKIGIKAVVYPWKNSNFYIFLKFLDIFLSMIDCFTIGNCPECHVDFMFPVDINV